jgi:hypothetical protein
MKNVFSTLVAASAVLVFAGGVFAEEQFPTQEATVTITVTTADGKVLQEDTVTDSTKGADTAAQFKALQKMKSQEKEKTSAPEKQKTNE